MLKIENKRCLPSMYMYGVYDVTSYNIKRIKLNEEFATTTPTPTTTTTTTTTLRKRKLQHNLYTQNDETVNSHPRFCCDVDGRCPI